MKSNSLKMFSCIAAVLAHSQTADAGVRHSRSLGGTGSNIPRSEQRRPAAGEQAVPFTPAVPNQAPSQTAPQPVQLQPSAQPVQPGQPVIVAPPVPVQIPTQMSFEPPVQIPQQQQPQQQQQPAQMQAPVQIPQQAQPAQMQPPMQVPQQLQPAQMQPPVQVPQQPQPAQMQNPVQVPRQLSTQPLPQQGLPSQPPMSPAASLSDRYVQPSYGMAGCGLGSMIFKKNVRSEQWLASIINDIFIPQSIMITTGTSNCVDVDEEQMQAEQEIFIDTNLHALRLEAARGEGENLRAFADLLGCQRDGLFDTFASSSQGQHSFIFSDSQPASVADRYREVLKRSRALKSRCERLF